MSTETLYKTCERITYLPENDSLLIVNRIYKNYSFRYFKFQIQNFLGNPWFFPYGFHYKNQNTKLNTIGKYTFLKVSYTKQL